jgi:nickel superoxide dismutase
VNWIARVLQPNYVANAHCDLYCGVYDPAQAKIEAMSCLKTAQKYQDSDDEAFRARAIFIKEERAELAKHHVSVLATDFFKAHHYEQYSGLYDLMRRAGVAAGDAKKSMDPAVSQNLVDLIDEISGIFWQTDESKATGVYPPH